MKEHPDRSYELDCGILLYKEQFEIFARTNAEIQKSSQNYYKLINTCNAKCNQKCISCSLDTFVF